MLPKFADRNQCHDALGALYQAIAGYLDGTSMPTSGRSWCLIMRHFQACRLTLSSPEPKTASTVIHAG